VREADFSDWLHRYFRRAVAATRFSNVRRVETEFGDLDIAYDQDRLAGVIAKLTYGKAEEDAGAPNPTSIPISGDIRKGLSTLKTATKLYLEFRSGEQAEGEHAK